MALRLSRHRHRVRWDMPAAEARYAYSDLATNTWARAPKPPLAASTRNADKLVVVARSEQARDEVTQRHVHPLLHPFAVMQTADEELGHRAPRTLPTPQPTGERSTSVEIATV